MFAACAAVLVRLAPAAALTAAPTTLGACAPRRHAAHRPRAAHARAHTALPAAACRRPSCMPPLLHRCRSGPGGPARVYLTSAFMDTTRPVPTPVNYIEALDPATGQVLRLPPLRHASAAVRASALRAFAAAEPASVAAAACWWVWRWRCCCHRCRTLRLLALLWACCCHRLLLRQQLLQLCAARPACRGAPPAASPTRLPPCLSRPCPR